MAAPNLDLSRPGVVNADAGSWDKDNKLFLKVFSGEVLESFARENVFSSLIQSRTISSGKSAQFPVMGRFGSRHHTPGNMIIGQDNMAQNEVVIRVDDLLISDCSLYDLDEAKAHFDVRSIYSQELGRAMARALDQRLARVLTLGARQGTADLAADTPDTLLSPLDDPKRTGTRIDIGKADPTGDDLVAAVFTAAETLDKKDVPQGDRYLACTPEMFYTLIQSSRAVNFDFNQQGVNGSYKEGQIAKLAGFNIIASNNIEQGNVTASTGENGQEWNQTTVANSSVDMSQTKMLAFHRSAAGVVKLRDLSLQMSGNDYNVMYQATLMLARMAYGAGYLRPEACVEVFNTL